MFAVSSATHRGGPRSEPTATRTRVHFSYFFRPKTPVHISFCPRTIFRFGSRSSLRCIFSFFPKYPFNILARTKGSRTAKDPEVFKLHDDRRWDYMGLSYVKAGKTVLCESRKRAAGCASEGQPLVVGMMSIPRLMMILGIEGIQQALARTAAAPIRAGACHEDDRLVANHVATAPCRKATERHRQSPARWRRLPFVNERVIQLNTGEILILVVNRSTAQYRDTYPIAPRAARRRAASTDRCGRHRQEQGTVITSGSRREGRDQGGAGRRDRCRPPRGGPPTDDSVKTFNRHCRRAAQDKNFRVRIVGGDQCPQMLAQAVPSPTPICATGGSRRGAADPGTTQRRERCPTGERRTTTEATGNQLNERRVELWV